MNLPETVCYPTPVCVSGEGFVLDNKTGILHKTSNAMSPLSSVEARPICVRGRGEKKARSKKCLWRNEQIPNWKLIMGFPRRCLGSGIYDRDSGYQRKIGVTFGWSILCNGCGIERKSPSEYWGDWGKICVRTIGFIIRTLLGTIMYYRCISNPESNSAILLFLCRASWKQKCTETT